MADSFILIVGSREYELVYDALNQADYQIALPVNLEAGMPDVLLHQPDGETPTPIRAKNVLRTVTFYLIVRGDNWPDTINLITPLKRALNSADSESLQYGIAQERPPIVLRVQLDGMTNYTDHNVLWGYVNDSAAVHRVYDKKTAWLVPVQLQLEEAGYGEQLVLRNELSGSPHMLLAGSTSGLAAGLSLVGSPTSYALDESKGIIKQSQTMTVPSTGTVGFETAVVSRPKGTPCAAYVWLSQEAGNLITVSLMDGSGNVIQSKECGPSNSFANSDMTFIDRKGFTWRRVRVQGVNNTAADFKLRVARDTSDAASTTTWWSDLIYLQTTDSINLIKYPEMDVDADSDDMVDGWSWNANKTTLRSLSNTIYFSSAYSQKIGDGSGTVGFISEWLPVVPGEPVVATFWLQPDTGTTTIRLIDNFLSELDTATFVASSPSGYETTATGDDTNTWYKYKLEATPTNALTTAVRLWFSGTGNITYIDDVEVYQGSGESDLSNTIAWVSPYQPYNRHYPTAANPERINTIDLWGIPGDMNAILSSRWVIGGNTKRRFYFSRWIDGLYDAVDRQHVLTAYQPDDTDWTRPASPSATNGVWTTPTDSNTNAGTTVNFEASGGVGSGSYELLSVTYPHYLERLFASLRRAFLQAKASSTTAVLGVKIEAGSASNRIELLNAPSLSLGAANSLQLLDAGLLNGLGLLARMKDKWKLGANFYVTWSVSSVPLGETVDFDTLWLLPVDESGEFLLTETKGASGVAGRSRLFMFGEEKSISLDGQTEEPNVSGSFYEARPGDVVNRIAILQTESDNDLTITDYMRVTLYAIPRTSYLLGTQ